MSRVSEVKVEMSTIDEAQEKIEVTFTSDRGRLFMHFGGMTLIFNNPLLKKLIALFQ